MKTKEQMRFCAHCLTAGHYCFMATSVRWLYQTSCPDPSLFVSDLWKPMGKSLQVSTISLCFWMFSIPNWYISLHGSLIYIFKLYLFFPSPFVCCPPVLPLLCHRSKGSHVPFLFEGFLSLIRIQTKLSASWEICMQVKKQQFRTRHGRMDWFKIGKGVYRGCILSSCLYNCVQSTLWEMWAGWSTIMPRNRGKQ